MSGEPLIPLVVHSSGRSGTTMTMALLASSPEVAMEREYPYEHAYLAWMTEWSALADSREWDIERWSSPALAQRQFGRKGDGMVGPPPWPSRSLWAAEQNDGQMGTHLLLAAWREFSVRAATRTRRELGAKVLYHAEKALSVARLRERAPFPVRAVVLHRDTRDVWLSVQAFNRARGFHGFGRAADEGEDEWFERFLQDHAQRLRDVLAERGREDSILIAYEDLVLQPEATAKRLGYWLGVELDPAAPALALAGYSHHSTSASPESSVGRWRWELEPERRERFSTEMGTELRDLGYAD